MTTNERILVVEDEEDIRELIIFNLRKNGFSTETAVDGEEAMKKLRRAPFDLLLLDLMLPGRDGWEVCREIKSSPSHASIPIIMVTAKGEEEDIVAGLEMGADDYITKPFSPRVLLSRVRAVLRRRRQTPPSAESMLRIHDLVIDPRRREVLAAGRRVDLTPTEFALLHFLARRPGWVFTRSQIIDGIRGENYAVTERAVDVQVLGLRRKLGEAGRYIETVRGVGYRFRE